MFLHIGTNSYIKIDEIESISPPESAPVKRLVNASKDNNSCIELTYGKRIKSVIVLKSGKVVLSAILPQTLVDRIASKN